LETTVTNGLVIAIALTRQVQEQEQEAVQPRTEYAQDDSLPAGTVKVVEGSPGIRMHTYTATYKNGERVGRVEVGAPTMVQDPVPTRQITGTKAVSQSRPTI